MSVHHRHERVYGEGPADCSFKIQGVPSLSVVIVLCWYLCCSVIIVLFYVLIVCTVTLPPGVNPIAVDKYIFSVLLRAIFSIFA